VDKSIRPDPDQSPDNQPSPAQPPGPKGPPEPAPPETPHVKPDFDPDIPEHPGPPLSDPESPHGNGNHSS